jgi:excisionase family DNA binding protein
MAPTPTQTTKGILQVLTSDATIEGVAKSIQEAPQLMRFVLWLWEKQPALFTGLDKDAMEGANWRAVFDQLHGITRYYSIGEIAALLSVTRATVYNYIKRGLLKADYLGTRMRISQESIDALWEKSYYEVKNPKGGK